MEPEREEFQERLKGCFKEFEDSYRKNERTIGIVTLVIISAMVNFYQPLYYIWVMLMFALMLRSSILSYCSALLCALPLELATRTCNQCSQVSTL